MTKSSGNKAEEKDQKSELKIVFSEKKKYQQLFFDLPEEVKSKLNVVQEKLKPLIARFYKDKGSICLNKLMQSIELDNIGVLLNNHFAGFTEASYALTDLIEVSKAYALQNPSFAQTLIEMRITLNELFLKAEKQIESIGTQLSKTQKKEDAILATALAEGLDTQKLFIILPELEENDFRNRERLENLSRRKSTK